MTLRVVFRRAAQDEFFVAAAWYERQRGGLGIEFVAEIESAMTRAAESPALYPKVYGDIRKAATRRFPYNIFFRERGEFLVVLAIFHGRRGRQNWPRRT